MAAATAAAAPRCFSIRCRCYYYNCIGYDIAVLSFSRLLCIPIVFLRSIYSLSRRITSLPRSNYCSSCSGIKREAARRPTPEQVHYCIIALMPAKQRAKISCNRGEPSALHTGQWMPRLHSNERHRAHY